MRFIAFVLILTTHLYTQSKDTSSDTHSGKNDASGDKLPYEEGDVTIRIQDSAVRLQAVALANIKTINPSLENDGKKDVAKGFLDSYLKASSLIQKNEFVQARRDLTTLNKKISEEVKAQGNKFKTNFEKYSNSINQEMLEMELQGSSKTINISSLKQISTDATLNYRDGIRQTTAENHVEALLSFRESVKTILESKIFFEKEKTQNLSSKERFEKNLFLDVDYLPKEYVKDYDDACGKVSETEEKKREKEREDFRKAYDMRLNVKTKVPPKKEDGSNKEKPSSDKANAESSKSENKDSNPPKSK